MSKSKRPRASRPGPKDRVVRIVEMEVTFDPIPDPQVEALPEAWRSKLTPVLEQRHDDMSVHLELLKDAIAFAPDIPVLWNWLAIGYMHAGQLDEVNRLRVEVYQRFPDYLIGKLNYCRWLLDEGRKAEVLPVLGGSFDLTQVAGRSRFHYTELVNFYVFLSDYRIADNDLEGAQRTLDTLSDMVGVEHSAIDAAYRRLIYAKLKNGFQGLLGGPKKRSRSRR